MTYFIVCELSHHERPHWEGHTAEQKIEHLVERIGKMAQDITQLTADLASLTSDAQAASARVALDLADLHNQIADLQRQVSSLTAGTITQAQIDSLDAAAKAADATLIGIDPTIIPVPVPDPAPAPDPVPAPIPSPFVQGTNPDGTLMVDPITGVPVDQNGQPEPAVV